MKRKEIWRFRTSEIIALPVFHKGRIYVGSGDSNFYCLDFNGKEVWRFKAGADVFWQPVIWKDRVYFTSWDCHLYCVDLEGKEIWRFATSSLAQAEWPPAFEGWEAEVKKETQIEDAITEEKYKSKKSETVSLSDYHVTSEYASTSEYKQKSDYDVNFVMFEGVLEGEDLWISGSKVSIPQISRLR